MQSLRIRPITPNPPVHLKHFFIFPVLPTPNSPSSHPQPIPSAVTNQKGATFQTVYEKNTHFLNEHSQNEHFSKQKCFNFHSKVRNYHLWKPTKPEPCCRTLPSYEQLLQLIYLCMSRSAQTISGWYLCSSAGESAKGHQNTTMVMSLVPRCPAKHCREQW